MMMREDKNYHHHPHKYLRQYKNWYHKLLDQNILLIRKLNVNHELFFELDFVLLEFGYL